MCVVLADQNMDICTQRCRCLSLPRVAVSLEICVVFFLLWTFIFFVSFRVVFDRWYLGATNTHTHTNTQFTRTYSETSPYLSPISHGPHHSTDRLVANTSGTTISSTEDPNQTGRSANLANDWPEKQQQQIARYGNDNNNNIFAGRTYCQR